jgi:hypothetical protein
MRIHQEVGKARRIEILFISDRSERCRFGSYPLTRVRDMAGNAPSVRQVAAMFDIGRQSVLSGNHQRGDHKTDNHFHCVPPKLSLDRLQIRKYGFDVIDFKDKIRHVRMTAA